MAETKKDNPRPYTSTHGSLPRSGLTIPMPAGAKPPAQGVATPVTKPTSSASKAATK